MGEKTTDQPREKVSLKRKAKGTYHRWGSADGVHGNIPAGDYFVTARFDKFDPETGKEIHMVQIAVDLGNEQPSIKHIYRLAEDELRGAMDCDHKWVFRDYCGCHVCTGCGQHAHVNKRGEVTQLLDKCFCGWNLAPGEVLEDDVEI